MAFDGIAESVDGSDNGADGPLIHQDMLWTALVNAGVVLPTDDVDKAMDRINVMSEPQARKFVSLVLEYKLTEVRGLKKLMSVNTARVEPWIRGDYDDPVCVRGARRMALHALNKLEGDLGDVNKPNLLTFEQMMAKATGVTGTVFFLDLENVSTPMDLFANVLDGQAYSHPVVFCVMGPGRYHRKAVGYDKRTWCCIGSSAVKGRDTADICLALLAHTASATADRVVICTKDHFGAILAGNLGALGVNAMSYTDHELIYHWNDVFGQQLGLINVPRQFADAPKREPLPDYDDVDLRAYNERARELIATSKTGRVFMTQLLRPLGVTDELRNAMGLNPGDGVSKYFKRPETLAALDCLLADGTEIEFIALNPRPMEEVKSEPSPKPDIVVAVQDRDDDMPGWFKKLVAIGAITLHGGQPPIEPSEIATYNGPVPLFPSAWIAKEVIHKSSGQVGMVINACLGDLVNPTPRVLVKVGAKMPRWWYLHDVCLKTRDGPIDGSRAVPRVRPQDQV